MKIINNSKMPTRKIRTLLDFATRGSLYHDLGVLIVRDKTRAGYTTSGCCYRRDPDPDTYEPLTPSVIVIDVGYSVEYPHAERYVKEVDAIDIHCPEEEMLLVLAHEIRHLDQVWRWQHPPKEHEAEVEAEKYALSVLANWRDR